MYAHKRAAIRIDGESAANACPAVTEKISTRNICKYYKSACMINTPDRLAIKKE